jgi:hypothetical protein
MASTQAIEDMKALTASLDKVYQELWLMEGWLPSELMDKDVQTHLAALKLHIDNAVGRCNMTLRRLQAIHAAENEAVQTAERVG